jgi:protein SCO1/2
MSRKPILIAGVVTAAIAAIAAFLLLRQTSTLHGSIIDPPMAAPEIALTDSTGQPLAFRSLEGNVVLLFFGYTNCPDECPLTMANLKRATESMGTDASRTRVLMVTTDPARDTPEELARFVGKFDPSFLGLTGTPQHLNAVWQAYGVTVLDSGETHSNYLYVIDPSGQLVETLPYDTEPVDIAADVKMLLRSD